MSIIFNSADIAETMNNGVANLTGADSTITENYTNVVQHGIKIDMSVSEKTISGTPPLTFNSNGTPLIDYTIYGNTVNLQSCGVPTENLFDKANDVKPWFVNASQAIQESATGSYSIVIKCEPNSTLNYQMPAYAAGQNPRIIEFDHYPSVGETGSNYQTYNSPDIVYTTSNSAKYLVMFVYNAGAPPAISPDVFFARTMINYGTTPLPYEPYGYKIPISVSGRIYNVYIGNSPLRKAIDSSNAVDTINYGTQQLIRRVDSNGTALSEPVTETIEVPQITTIDGINVIDVQTTPKPSNISITYKGR